MNIKSMLLTEEQNAIHIQIYTYTILRMVTFSQVTCSKRCLLAKYINLDKLVTEDLDVFERMTKVWLKKFCT